MSTLASVCPGVSLERAYYQSDVVMEVELRAEVVGKGLQILEKDDAKANEQVSYSLTAFSFDVTRVWKGKHIETTLIYVDTMSTNSYHFKEDEKYVVFAGFFDPQEGIRVWQTDEEREHDDHHTTRCRTCLYAGLQTHEESDPLYTASCRGNSIIRDDESSVLIKEKLDRIQAESNRPVAVRERSVHVRNLIRDILKSNKERTPALESASPRNDSSE